MSKINRKLKKGQVVYLSKDINAIPSGIYRFKGRDDVFFFFSVGNKIRFAISRDCKPYIRFAARSDHETSTLDFVPRYYALLHKIKGQPFDPSTPISFCAMPPDLAYEVN